MKKSIPQQKTIHTFTFCNQDGDCEIQGEYQQAIKDTLDYINNFQDDKKIRVLWTKWVGYWSENLKCYIGKSLENILSRCLNDGSNAITVKEFKNILKSKLGGEIYNRPEKMDVVYDQQPIPELNI